MSEEKTESFDSTEDKRTNNFLWPPENYTGPDDVALRYNTLSDEEKKSMMLVKVAAQHLINTLRSLGSHIDIDLAIEHAQDASMRGVRYITQSSKQ